MSAIEGEECHSAPSELFLCCGEGGDGQKDGLMLWRVTR